MKKYITSEQWSRAKDRDAYDITDSDMPMETRKVFPFHVFDNFHLTITHTAYWKLENTNRIPPFMCGNCGCDLSENGNSLYYTAYIVFDSPTEFYPCCRECLPDDSLEYDQQVYGHKKAMTLGKYQDSILHNAVIWMVWQKFWFEAWNYPKGIDMAKAKEAASYFDGGGSFMNGYIEAKGMKAKVLDKQWNVLHTLTPATTLKLINEIIADNFERRNSKPIIPPEGIQLQFFSH